MDVQQAPAAVALGLGKTDTSDKTSEDKLDAAGREAFSQLLQGLKQEESAQIEGGATEAPVLDVDPLLQQPALAAPQIQELGVPSSVAIDAQAATQLSAVDEDSLSPEIAALVEQMGISDLVRQTQRLDAVAEQVNVDQQQLQHAMQGLVGPAISATAPATLATTVGHAWGSSVATVAAGVAQSTPLALGLPSTGVGVAAAAWGEVTGTTDAVLQTVTELAGPEPETEGRVSLLGAWRFETPEAQAHPVLQRLVGQIEQWAVATAGLQPRGNDKQDVGRAVAEAGAAWLSSNHGSQTQLTENAVRETQSTQDAAFEAATDVPQEDMRFWVQGKQHRADILMDRDGQAVRVQVSVRGNEAQVTFLSDQAQTREMLDESVAQLREMLEQQGVVLSGVTVQADARGQGKDGASPQQNAWESGKVQHASVAVPIDGVAAAAPRATTGVDLYA